MTLRHSVTYVCVAANLVFLGLILLLALRQHDLTVAMAVGVGVAWFNIVLSVWGGHVAETHVAFLVAQRARVDAETALARTALTVMETPTARVWGNYDTSKPPRH